MLDFSTIVPLQKTLIGYSPQSAAQLYANFEEGRGAENIGDFILIVQGRVEADDVTLIFSTPICAIPYYYYQKDNVFEHGKSMIDVFHKTNIAWKYDELSLFTLFAMEHTIDNRSLHTDIKRLPANHLLYFRAGKLQTSLLVSDNISYINDIKKYSLSEKIDYLAELFKTFQLPQSLVISMSAGLDSRLMLALAKHHGHQVTTYTVGNETSTDQRIARQISQDFGHQHHAITLNQEDYFSEKNAQLITQITGGETSLTHWHSHLYASKFTNFGLDKTPQLIGVNGEMIRHFYFDMGIVNKLVNTLGINLFETLFQLKWKKNTAQIPLYFSEKQQKNALNHLCNLSLNTHERLQHLYTCTRVRHFTGNGLALVNAYAPAMSPFLDYRFTLLAKSLTNSEQLNGYFHKRAIQQFAPSLIQYPNADNVTDIADFETNFYCFRKKRTTSYSILAQVMSSAQIQSFVMDNHNRVQDFFKKNELEKMLLNQNYAQIATIIALIHLKIAIEKKK